jgi:formate dehydrogenase major subunit
MRYGRGYPGPVETQFDIDVPVPVLTARAPVPERPLAGRDGFDEVEMALDVETARLESRRCFSCGRPWGRYRTCWFCLPCEIECPHKALTVEIPYLLR